MQELEKKYYSVKCKCGHVGGNKYYIPIEFAVIGVSKKEAAQKARWIPRCKHNKKDCILEVKELNRKEYIELINKNNSDPYLRCKSIQEQRKYDFSDRIMLEPQCDKTSKSEKEANHYLYKKRWIKHPKQYMKEMYKMEEAYCY